MGPFQRFQAALLLLVDFEQPGRHPRILAVRLLLQIDTREDVIYIERELLGVEILGVALSHRLIENAPQVVVAAV